MSNTEKMVSVPRVHELKIHSLPLEDLLSGSKTAEVRDCSDRDFAVGDTVWLREVGNDLAYTGREIHRTITHIQKNYGLPEHACVLSYGKTVDHSEQSLDMVPERQGEPVSLPARADHESMEQANPGFCEDEDYACGWNDCLDEIAKIGPLYTRQVQGEPVTESTRKRRERWIENIKSAIKAGLPKNLRTSLERSVKEIENSIQYGGTQLLRVRCEELEQELSGLAKYTDSLISQRDEGWMERERLRAQMGEQDSLLRESSEFMYIMTGNNAPRDLDAEYGKEGWEGAIGDLRGRIALALSASAEPIPDHSVEANKKVERDEPKCKSCHDQGEVFVRKGDVHYGMETEPEPIMAACNDCKIVERHLFESNFPIPDWAEWSDLTQTYVVKEDMICSATALAMYRKAWQAWMASAEVVR